MLRRFSSKFTGKRKDDAHNMNGETNGMVNSDHKSTSLPVQKPDAPDYSVTQGDVQSNFEKFAHLLHASNRPLPTQSGDGAYLEEGQPSSFLKDIRTFGYKDYNTMMQVMKGKATGELQEYVICLFFMMNWTTMLLAPQHMRSYSNLKGFQFIAYVCLQLNDHVQFRRGSAEEQKGV